MVLIKKTFSGQPDNVLRPIREVILNRSDNAFPFEEIVNKLKGTPKSIIFDDDEIENILYYQYGQAYTYSALAFLYPTLDFRNKFHQDHVFPKTLFTRKKLQKRGIADEKIDFYLENYNRLANLQLLEGIPNQEKSSKDFDLWLKEKFPNQGDRQAFMDKHYIPDIELSLENFEEFIIKRQELMISAFKRMFHKDAQQNSPPDCCIEHNRQLVSINIPGKVRFVCITLPRRTVIFTIFQPDFMQIATSI